MELIRLRDMLENGNNIFDLPLRVVFYARVSTEKDMQINSLNNQIEYYEELIKNNKMWTYTGGYVDEGISGTSVEKRDKFRLMIEDGIAGKFDLIITKEISRFSRNTLDSIAYTQKLLKYGVGVFFQTDNINTLMPDAELRLTIMAGIAQDEVRRLSERCRFGFKRAMENGKVLGQDNMFGYRKKNGRLTIVEEEAQIIRKIYNKYLEGTDGIRRISVDLENEGIKAPNDKAFSYGTIKNILTNPKYKGFYCGRKTFVPSYREKRKIRLDKSEWLVYKDEKVPAIVPEDVWDRVNALYEQRGEKSKKNSGAFQNRYPYSGKIICGEHNVSFHRILSRGKKREGWSCKIYREKGREGCDSPTIYTDELNTIMAQVIKQIYDNKESVIPGLLNIYSNYHTVKDYNKEVEQKESEILNIYKKQDIILNQHLSKGIDSIDYKIRNDNYTKEIALLRSQIEIIKSEKKNSGKIRENIELFKKTLEESWNGNIIFDEKMLSNILEKIVVHKSEDESRTKLDIFLKLGGTFFAEYDSGQGFISLYQIGISQAQVSRLEKSALMHVKKHV